MKRFLCLTMCLAFALQAANDPHIGYLYPAGAQAGTQTRIRVGGQNLGGMRGGVVEGTGVKILKITQVPSFPRPDGKQRIWLLKWIESIEAGNPTKPPLPEDTSGWLKNDWWERLDQLDPLSFELLLQDLHARRNPLQAAPALRQLLIVELDIAPDAAPGEREFRLWGRNGVSAPKIFRVDAAPHTPEPSFTAPGKPRPGPPEIARFPAVLDGQILPGETDCFRILLEAGRDVSFRLTGRRFSPFLGDAVPGHFQPVLRLLDPHGREAAFADDEYSDPDPVLRFRAPETGMYTLEVRDNLYRGREDFVYHIAVEPGISPHRFEEEIPFPGLPRLQADGVLPLHAPGVLEGVLGTPGARAAFRFSGKAGQRVVFDAAARRFGSPLDGVLTLSGPDGKILAESDDHILPLDVGRILQPFDPYLFLTLPCDGEYRLALRDLTGAGDANYAYWLRIGPPMPDFQVYTKNSMLNLAPGATGKLQLHVLRLDGFTGSIRLSAEGATLLGSSVIPAEATEFTIVLRNRAAKLEAPQPIRLFAETESGESAIRHSVIPADTFDQAFAYQHLLPAKTFYIGTIRPAGR